jgi:ATP-dependent protease Clp ATPase subunit
MALAGQFCTGIDVSVWHRAGHSRGNQVGAEEASAFRVPEQEDLEIDKSNVLVLGPTGAPSPQHIHIV